MTIRKSVRALTDAEKQSFVDAVWGLKNESTGSLFPWNNTYDMYVILHREAMTNLTPWASDPPTVPSDPATQRNSAHRGPSFLPWHREFLRRFEADLQRVSGDSNISIPYWDWELDPAFPEFLGGDGIRTTDVDVGGGQIVTVNAFNIVVDGPFGVPESRLFDPSYFNDPSVWKGLIFNPNTGVYNPFPLQRTFGDGMMPIWDRNTDTLVTSSFGPYQTPITLPSKQEVDQALTIDEYDSGDWDEDVKSFRNILEGWWYAPGLHNRVHGWVGGSMGPGTSPSDPIFFLHHSNVDRIWDDWQKKFPNATYQPQSNGPDGHNFGDVMFPWDGVTMTDRVQVKDAVSLGSVSYDPPPPA